MAAAGLLGGLIMPSRDMLVRAAAPPGAVGRTFGVVTTGFNFAGMVGPLMFGYIMDQGAPRWVFLVSMIFMMITALAAWLGDRHVAAKRRDRAGRGRGRRRLSGRQSSGPAADWTREILLRAQRRREVRHGFRTVDIKRLRGAGGQFPVPKQGFPGSHSGNRTAPNRERAEILDPVALRRRAFHGASIRQDCGDFSAVVPPRLTPPGLARELRS